jgi:photosystem II stability/assembly factor-like uncharacterized protein
MKTKLYLSIIVTVFTLTLKAQWTSEASGFSTNGFAIIDMSAVNSNVVWATGLDTNFSSPSNVFTKTLDGGTTWTAGTISGAGGYFSNGVFAHSKDTAWISLNDLVNGGGFIYKTSDGGATWVAQPTATFATPAGYVDDIYFFDKNNGVCIGDSNTGYWEIYKTTNGGTNWSRILAANIPSNTPGETGSVDSYCVNGNTIWFGTSAGRVYKSTNMGATWTVTSTGLTLVYKVVFKDAMNGLAIDGGGSLVKSTDGGATWSTLSYTGNLYGFDLCFVPGTTGTYYSTGAGPNGSSYSLNDGQTWINIDGLQHTALAFINSTTGWSGGVNASPTSGGVFKWTGAATGIKSNAFPDGVESDLYPNPFTSETTLKLNTKNTDFSKLSVEVFDVLGKSVLKRNDFDSFGQMKIQKDNLKSGVYFYKVYDSNSTIGNGRMVIE